MTDIPIEKILECLCYYDKRNPNNNNDGYTEQEIKEAQVNCYCDNCFYGKTKLAEYILKLLKHE